MNIDTVLRNRQRENKPPRGAIMLSVVIHVALILGLIFGSRIFMKQPRFTPFISAKMVPAKGLPSYRSVKSRSSGRKKSTVTKKASSSKKNSVKIPDIKKNSDKKRRTSSAKKEKPREVNKQERISTGRETGEEQDSGRFGRPDGFENGAGIQSGTVATVGMSDFNFPWYTESVKDILSRNWVKGIAPPNLRGTRVVVNFRVHKDGRISDVKLILPSNNLPLDQEVIRAVMKSSPLPPLPKALNKESQVWQYVFVY